MQEISNTYCVLPWTHISTYTNGDMRICCRGDKIKQDNGRVANLNSTTIDSEWNNVFMRDIRSSIMRGEYHSACWRCEREERATGSSRRNYENQIWSQHGLIQDLVSSTQPDGSVSLAPSYLDLRLGNQCNLKCVMCNTNNSTQWQQDYRRIKTDFDENNIVLANNFDFDLLQSDPHGWHQEKKWLDWFRSNISQIKILYFAGGEPMLLKSHEQMLSFCIDAGVSGNISLRYDSNGTYLLEHLLEMWKYFKNVHFNFSIDGVGARNDYIRAGSNWDNIETSLDLLDNLDIDIHLTAQCAVGVLNSWYIPELYDWFISKNFKRASMFALNEILSPNCLSAQIIPVESKVKLTDRLLEHASAVNNSYYASKLRWYVNRINSADQSKLVPDFLQYVNTLDSIRNTEWRSQFPEIYELLQL